MLGLSFYQNAGIFFTQHARQDSLMYLGEFRKLFLSFLFVALAGLPEVLKQGFLKV